MATEVHWRLLDETGREVRSGSSPPPNPGQPSHLNLGLLQIGWYRLETQPGPAAPPPPFTTLAVLHPLTQSPPPNTPVAVDAAIAWFAASDPARQQDFANLAALAGVRTARDRLRWRDLQPSPGNLVTNITTYDTAAEAETVAGLEVLQVFHDTPPWARDPSGRGGRFAPDLRAVYEFARLAALRFRGRVAAWEPWNEANVASFGGHTVDQMCSWQKAAYLGFKAGDPDVLVGWNPTAAVPTPAHTEGVLANRTWPYFDTYNIHSYDWAHGYENLWEPARRAAAGKPIWVTEADRGTRHLGNPPWFDQDRRLEALKAEWIPQAYASSLFAGAQRHFHFVLGAYHEPNGVQFGLLRRDLTPRPAYAALAATGRCLAGATPLGRWRPGEGAEVHAFRARPDGLERDVLVAWVGEEMDWEGRGRSTARVALPPTLQPVAVIDHLGRPQGDRLPNPLTTAPVFVLLPKGQASRLPLEPPRTPAPAPSPSRLEVSPMVLQVVAPDGLVRRIEDLPWSESYAYEVSAGKPLDLPLHAYHFGTEPWRGRLRLTRHPSDWEVRIPQPEFVLSQGGRDTNSLSLRLLIPEATPTRDAWIVLEAEGRSPGIPTLALRVRPRPPTARPAGD